MLRRSRIPLNSTDPSVMHDVVEHHSTSAPQSSLKNSQTIANSFKFMIPPGQLFCPVEPVVVNPQPRLKSLIKLEHLLRPSPSIRLGGPRRVASAPSPIIHGLVDRGLEYDDRGDLTGFPAKWHTQSTPRNRIISINGLKTRFPAQLSDSEIFSDDDGFTSGTPSLEDTTRSRQQDYSSPSSSSSSSMSSVMSSNELGNHSGIQDSKLPEKLHISKGNSSPPVGFPRLKIRRTLLDHEFPDHEQVISKQEEAKRPEHEESQDFKNSIPRGIRQPSMGGHQPLNASTDSHPHRRSRRKQTSSFAVKQTEVKHQDFQTNNETDGLLSCTPVQDSIKPDPIKSALSNQPGIQLLPPSQKNLGHAKISRATTGDRSSHSFASMGLPESSRNPQIEKTRNNTRASSPKDGLDEKLDTTTHARNSMGRGLKAPQNDVTETINTKGLTPFIRSVKYGILQLVSSSDKLKQVQSDGHPHVRLWINNQPLLERIPGNLISISSSGDKIEILNTQEEVSEKSTVEELNESFHQAMRKVLFYSLDALPIQIRVIYDYLRKFLMIMLGGVPRAVFQLHTTIFQQRVRCAIMMNGPKPDVELEWCDESLKIKVSKNRGKIKVWIKDAIVYHDPGFNHLNQDLSEHLVTVLMEIFELQNNDGKKLNNAGELEDCIHPYKLEKLQDWLDFIHPCLKILNEIENTLDQTN